MHAYLDEIIKEVKISSNNSHKVKLTWKGDRDYIFMDEKLGINIFTNLLTNAMKFSPKAKKIDVFVDTTADETIVIVKDFGIGIDPAEINKVFEPFHRAENVGAISGSGLGLSIAKKAIDLHEGTIEVKSEIGKGTEFVVTIPCLC